MSDDIVMRLRASSLAWRIALMPEAADEIGRLRSALDTAIRERDEARAEVDRLQSKVDTAKGIIEKLLTVMPVFPRGYTPSPHNPYDVAIESARTFLEKPHD